VDPISPHLRRLDNAFIDEAGETASDADLRTPRHALGNFAYRQRASGGRKDSEDRAVEGRRNRSGGVG
jgi:hypothetical protein